MKTIDDVIRSIRDDNYPKKIEMIDFRFVDLFGVWHHVGVPACRLDEKVMTQGIAFDGSSLGFKSVHAGDMVIVPDLSTVLYDPFVQHGTLGVICNVAEAGEAPELVGAVIAAYVDDAVDAEGFQVLGDPVVLGLLGLDAGSAQSGAWAVEDERHGVQGG